MNAENEVATPRRTRVEGTRQLAGAAGLGGALLFFAGDMLFYGHVGSGSGFHQGLIATVRSASLARFYAGRLAGPVGVCLCIVGF